MDALAHVLEHKIVAIIRGADPDDVLKITAALYKGGVRCVEITLNSKEALPVIEKLVVISGKDMLIGAGTVLDAISAKAAIEAGAKFIISPTFDPETIKATKSLGAISIPGGYSPTEIWNAYKNGADIIKVFPASIGPRYLLEIHAPMPEIPLMPTGGVALDNIKEYLKAGAVAVGIGSALVDTKQKVNKEHLKKITRKAAKFVEMVNGSNNKKK